MNKGWHPENMIEGNHYSVSYQISDEEVLHSLRGLYLGLKIHHSVLCLSFRGHSKGYTVVLDIPVTKVCEVSV